jgi:hypothetical protein
MASTGKTETLRRERAVSVGELLPEVGGLAFRRFGFARGALVTRWREVVGPVYARWSVPEALRPGRGKSGATLVIRVEGAFATQMHHVLPQIRERANRILGADAIASIRLVQGAVARPPASLAPAPDAAEAETSPTPGRNLQAIPDEGLRSALVELARALGEH